MARPQRKDTHLFFECETPKELLEQVFGIISTRSNNARTDRYIFRGVGSAEKHSLVPSALRKENLPRLLAQRNLDAPEADWGAEMLDDSNQSYLEIASLSLFYRYANQQALPLPAIPQEWHSAFVRTFDEAMDAPRCEDLDIDNWPPRSLWPHASILDADQPDRQQVRLLGRQPGVLGDHVAHQLGAVLEHPLDPGAYGRLGGEVGLEDQPERAPGVGHEVEVRLRGRRDPQLVVRGAGQPLAYGRDQRLDAGVEQREVQVELAREVLVQHRF